MVVGLDIFWLISHFWQKNNYFLDSSVTYITSYGGFLVHKVTLEITRSLF